jgi:hypothetical protein
MYSGGDQELVSREWLRRNVLENHGPLGDVYPRDAAGKKGVKEGDTPSFLYVLPNGLSDPEVPDWGSWGGRFQYTGPGWEYRDGVDTWKDARSPQATVFRWRRAYQNAFAARMDWCVKSPDSANHAPVAVCGGDRGVRIIKMDVRPGQTVELSAVGSSDPDGDAVSVRWWFYEEPSTCTGDVAIRNPRRERAELVVPEKAAGRSIHIILEVTDAGDPPLTSYRRVILRCRSKDD